MMENLERTHLISIFEYMGFKHADKVIEAFKSSVKITKDISIEFLEWAVTNANPIFPNKGRWSMKSSPTSDISTEELFYEFLKTKQ